MFSLLDGLLGDNQILVALDDRFKTTFQTKWGTYAYQKIPFVLINARENFQCAMDVTFRGLICMAMVVYLDDVTVYSKFRVNHIDDLRKILESCWKYGISLNPKKSIFCVTEGNLLWFVVCKEGMMIDPDRSK